MFTPLQVAVDVTLVCTHLGPPGRTRWAQGLGVLSALTTAVVQPPRGHPVFLWVSISAASFQGPNTEWELSLVLIMSPFLFTSGFGFLP